MTRARKPVRIFLPTYPPSSSGKVRVSGGSNLGSHSLCALVAGGDLSIVGAGADRTQFRGLVYSYGGLSVSDVTIVGSLVGASTAGRPMTLERANLVYDPEGVAIDLDLAGCCPTPYES